MARTPPTPDREPTEADYRDALAAVLAKVGSTRITEESLLEAADLEVVLTRELDSIGIRKLLLEVHEPEDPRRDAIRRAISRGVLDDLSLDALVESVLEELDR